jgi:hypothetical protein
MGFLRHIQPEKFILVNQKNRESTLTFPYSLFQLVKISLEGCSPAEPISVSLYKGKIERMNQSNKLCY